MNPTNGYARAFARQASSDFDTYECLCKLNSLPACHRLHRLQMACEKLTKAIRVHRQGHRIDHQHTHGGIANTLTIVAREFIRRRKPSRTGAPRNYDPVMTAIKGMAREIELLHPQVDDDGRRPENCEYPWEWEAGSGHYLSPSEYEFPYLKSLENPRGIMFLGILRGAILELQDELIAEAR